MANLEDIQETTQQIAGAIAAAMGVDVAIVDTQSKLLATSKNFLEKRGTDINEKFMEHVFKKPTFILPNPGFHEACQGCRYEGNCPETAEIHHTIAHKGHTLGVIFMVAYTAKQREDLLNNAKGVVEFLGEMAGLICSRIRLLESSEREQVAKKQLDVTINFIDSGIIAVDNAGRITQVNPRALECLRISQEGAIGGRLKDFIPEYTFDPVLKQGLKIRNIEVLTSPPGRLHFFLSANPVMVDGQVVGAVLSINDIKDLRSVVNKFSQNLLDYSFDDIHGLSEPITAIKQYAAQIAHGDSAVLINGETGTGKELFARAVHNHSKRRDQPFIPINCAAIPEALLESELFGYEEGAFSGARKGGKPGKFELANGGTIFLDEIGDMPLHMQVKLLRALQEKTVERVGGRLSISVDVRVIASTHQDLPKMVTNRTFRKDLYFRLNVMPLHIPPLRKRGEDIVILANHFIEKYSRKCQKDVRESSEEAMQILMAYDWPGNVRELENALEYAVNMAESFTVFPKDLPDHIKTGLKPVDSSTLDAQIRKHTLDIISKALDHHGHTLTGKENAARQLGISLPTLYRRIKQLGIKG